MAYQHSPLGDLKHCISPTAEIVEEALEGRMVILVDADDRENEGDLLIPAQFATPAAINFMAKHGRGLICLALTEERSEVLGLSPMTARNQTRHGTAFTASIEAVEGITTGISAFDRAHTIAVAIDPTKGSKDIGSPGHVFPLTAKDGGVLVRGGHTEAGVDIARLAGLIPAAVICEVMGDDGNMARLPELAAFAQFHNIKIGTISDLIAYRSGHDQFVERVSEAPFEGPFGTGFRLVVFRNRIDNCEHVALVKGEITPDAPVLVRVHRVEFVSDVIGGVKGRVSLIDKAIREIDAAGAGVLVLIRDLTLDALSRRFAKDGPPTENNEKALRLIGVGSQILRQLGARRIILLSNSQRRPVAIEGHGLVVESWRTFSD